MNVPVITHFDHSIDSSEIKYVLEENGSTVRNVTNIRHWEATLFFVDLEPNVNNE